MSFQNSYGADGSININVVPSFGRIVQVPENQKLTTVFTYHISRFLMSRHGNQERVHFINARLISILPDMFPLALKKSLKNQ